MHNIFLTTVEKLVGFILLKNLPLFYNLAIMVILYLISFIMSQKCLSSSFRLQDTIFVIDSSTMQVMTRNINIKT